MEKARTLGTVSRGIRLPIINTGDDIADITVKSVIASAEAEGYQLHDRDVIGITESVVARSQGNYATLDQIAADIRRRYPDGVVGVTLPILSRNRFSLLLKGIARGVKRCIVQLAFPSDEVGNPLISWDMLDEKNVDPYKDVFTEKEFRDIFGVVKHPFTGMDYIEYYKSLGDNIEIIMANDVRTILKYTPHVLTADIHTRARSKRLLRAAGAKTVYGLDDILSESVDGSGFNPDYGLLGSNMSTDEVVKLFPRNGKEVVDKVQAEILRQTGKKVEVLVYGDGAFKDPVGGIWELADPVVSPAYTDGLNGTNNEIKIKYIADNTLKGVRGEEAARAMKEIIKEKPQNENPMLAQGTTPRRLTDLLGSLCDLTTGSGEKGTPVVLIQGYFDNYATD